MAGNKPIHKIYLKAKTTANPQFVDVAVGWPSDNAMDAGVRYSIDSAIVAIEVRDRDTGEIVRLSPSDYYCNQKRTDSAPTQQRSIARKHRETRAADPVINDIGGDDEIPF